MPGDKGAQFWGRMGLFLPSAYAVGAREHPVFSLPRTRTLPYSCCREHSVSTPAERTLSGTAGAGGHSLRQTQPGPLLFLEQMAQGRSCAGREPARGAEREEFCGPACHGSGRCHFLSPCSPGQGFPPPFFSRWSGAPGGVCTFKACTRPSASLDCFQWSMLGKTKGSVGSLGGYTGAGQVERKERGSVLEEPWSWSPPEGVGWAWLGFPRYGGAGEVRTCPDQAGRVAALVRLLQDRGGPDGGGSRICFVFPSPPLRKAAGWGAAKVSQLYC